MQTEEEDPNDAVDYNPDSSDEERSLEDHRLALESQPEMALTVSTLATPSAIASNKEEAATTRDSVVPAGRRAVLDHSDILRMTSDKNYKFIKSIGNHEPQQPELASNIYNFDEELDGYTSPGGTVRMTKGVASVVLIALAADAPNTLVLKLFFFDLILVNEFFAILGDFWFLNYAVVIDC